MQISEVVPPCEGEPCRFPKLEECAHFHYERVQLHPISVELQSEYSQLHHSAHSRTDDEWFTLQVTSASECWLIQRTWENFTMLDEQLHQCIYDRKVSQLPELKGDVAQHEDLEALLTSYLLRLCSIIDNSLNCGPILNWFQLDNRGRRLLVPSEESRSINTPAVAAAYSVRKYVSQARDELSLEVGDMISVIDMAAPGESVWWRGKRGFQVGFFPQHCVHIIGDKVPRNMPLPPPVVGSLAISPIKPVLRKHGKLITFFRSFILNRPSRRRLKQSGILKERVFGCDLGEHLLNSGHDIPMVLKCCAEFIEKNGIVDGIYRLSGVTSNIQKLRNAFDEDRIPNLYTDDILQDIHSVASLLKMYFRELPNPLCTYQLYQSFVTAVQGCNSARSKGTDNDRLLKMREAVQKLPPPHYRTLEYLMRHLAKVAAHGQQTGMTTRNVAIVWAPNLLRCEELEVGGVAALQGVGVQAVVTEFLICYADLIFSDHLPNLTDTCIEDVSTVSPKRSRPKSLAISTPTKLITLEEARNKHLLNKSDEGTYIEVGGGPKNLPKKYHTVIELPAGSRKRSLTKRSPSGWRSFFSKSRNNSHGNLPKHIEISPPGELIITDKSVTESDLTEIKRKLRPVKSAESLTSGQSEPTPCDNDVLGPLYSLNKPPGHNRSVSHDSYFDNLQSSNNNSVGSLLDLSEIQLNFELEESEMRIFSEDESLVSSPKVQRETATRKGLSRARAEEFSSATNSSNPSPKKQARVVLSPDSLSRKRSRIEDQLSDIQYIDCNTPDNTCLISTTAVVHNLQEDNLSSPIEQYQPKNKSPRNSHALNRHSLNLENSDKIILPKSLTEMDIEKIKVPGSISSGFNLTPTPGTPNYKPLDSSNDSTPILSPDLSPDVEIQYENLNSNYLEDHKRPKSCYDNSETGHYENVTSKSVSPTYENIRTTISITYRSPVKSLPDNNDSIYEDVILNPEKAVVPTTVAELPKQEATQPEVKNENHRPKDLNINNDFRSIESPNSSSPVDMENSKKSLISTTEISMTDIHSGSDSPRSSTSLSPLSPKHHEKRSNLLISGTEISMTEPRSEISSRSSTPLSPLSPQKETQKSSSHNQQNTSNFVFSTEVSNEMRTEINSQSSSPLSPLSPKKTSPKNSTNMIISTTGHSLTEFTQSSESLSPLSPKIIIPEKGFNVTEYTNSQSSESLSPLSPPKHLKTLSSTQSMSAISSADAQTQNSTGSSEMSPVESLERRLKDDSSPSFNKLNYNDKRKSCDDEILDQNAIYQQVKYFRRSIHEINSLLDLENCEIKSEDAERLIADTNDIKEDTQMDSIENFDSLESENIHIYENVTSPKNSKGLDEGRSRMHDSEPKKIEISPEKLQDIPVCSKCLPDLEAQNSVKNLTNKFEAKEEKENEQIKDKKPKKYDKEGLPPCLQAKNAKNSVKQKSDENAFVTEFGRTNNQLQRRKSLDDRTSSYINSKLLIEPQTPSKSTLDVSEIEKITIECPVTEQKLNRERIEKYKEERRNFLREKYRSESFREDKDKILTRLKQKSFRKTEDAEKKLDNEPISTEYKESRLTDNDSKVNYKKLPSEALSKFEKEGAVTRTSYKKHHSPLVERQNRPSLKELSDKIFDDGNISSAVKREDDFIRDKKTLESEKKRHTFESVRERDSDTEARRVSLDSRNPRKEKVSPSYCIKDMKAIFESKSSQH